MNKIVYPIGDSSFESIRQEGRFYVDKTAFVYQLASTGKYYFLSRPRRFGKSLLVSTMDAYFRGRRDLFEGLAISKMEKDWTVYPVFRFDFSMGNMNDSQRLQDYIRHQLSTWEEEYGLSPAEYSSNGVRFQRVIEKAFAKTGSKVVVLIDEYDNPLFSTFGESEEHERMRDSLKDLYSILKGLSDKIKFCFLTGITRFSRMSLFSGLNNLRDLTLLPEYSAICGITQEEVDTVCAEGVETVARENKTDFEGAKLLLKDNYDGYHFGDMNLDIYNPYSLIQVFPDGRLRPYWFRSGTPEYLWKKIGELSDKESLLDVLNPIMTTDDLEAAESENLPLEALLFQSGYLTLKEELADGRMYRLGIPNLEVRQGIYQGLLPLISGKSQKTINTDLVKLMQYADRGETEEMLSFIKSFLAEIPNRVTRDMPEIYYENNLLILFMLLGVRVTAEQDTSDGRIDLAVETEKYVYIMEFKLNKSAQSAINQIKEKSYWLPYARKGKTIILVGVNFSSQKRNIDDWLIEKM